MECAELWRRGWLRGHWLGTAMSRIVPRPGRPVTAMFVAFVSPRSVKREVVALAELLDMPDGPPLLTIALLSLVRSMCLDPLGQRAPPFGPLAEGMGLDLIWLGGVGASCRRSG